VTSACVQLIAAARSKGDIGEPQQGALEEAAKAVMRAAQGLAYDKPPETESPPVESGGSFTQRQIQQVEQQTKIIDLEVQLQRAREDLGSMRKQDYTSNIM